MVMIHPVDRFAGVLQRSIAPRVFRDGWGDMRYLDALSVEDPGPPEPISPDLGPVERAAGCTWVRGSFESPERLLPEASRTARFVWARPEEGEVGNVVLLAAWGEHSLVPRLRMATRLAGHGIGSIVLENPLYGSRRTRPGQVITTVAEFAVMGRASVVEARSLAAWARGFGAVGLAGFSMGAGTAALAGALSPFPVAIGIMAAAHSPGPVWRDGVVGGSVDAGALGPDAIERLGTTLSTATVLDIPAPPHVAHAVIVAGSRDGYVPPETTKAIAEHWPGAELRWIDAGHGTLIWMHRSDWIDAIVDSFARVAAATGG